jgi:pyridoxamine 5'-phosphate oxidase
VSTVARRIELVLDGAKRAVGMSSDQRDVVWGDDPLALFRDAFERALKAESFDASRAALATVGAQGWPSVRFVLVKQVDARGFAFFTNFESRKARELSQNPHASLAFHWASLGEQVRVEGVVSRVSDSESDTYFATRPRGSQLGAWASSQSSPIASRAELDAQLVAVTQRFATSERVPRPEFWGGYRLAPAMIEFWIDRRDRMHDRRRFTRDGSVWQQVRLQP